MGGNEVIKSCKDNVIKYLLHVRSSSRMGYGIAMLKLKYTCIKHVYNTAALQMLRCLFPTYFNPRCKRGPVGIGFSSIAYFPFYKQPSCSIVKYKEVSSVGF